MLINSLQICHWTASPPAGGCMRVTKLPGLLWAGSWKIGPFINYYLFYVLYNSIFNTFNVIWHEVGLNCWGKNVWTRPMGREDNQNRSPGRGCSMRGNVLYILVQCTFSHIYFHRKIVLTDIQLSVLRVLQDREIMYAWIACMYII
jgi:hypothetical protein